VRDSFVTIDILCKVVDNYGDIGVVYRLAKALSDLDPGLRLRLVVDDLAAFRSLAPEIDSAKDVQDFRGWTVVRWDCRWEGFAREAPRYVLECFACGRPDYFEACLFDPGLGFTAHIINVEHLTAEAWADELHLMPSLTRSARVKKWIFMPGFTQNTGGLIIDRRFREAAALWHEARAKADVLASKRRSLAEALGLGLEAGAERRYWLSVFSYERDYGPIVADIAAFGRERPVLALLASGRSQACFLRAWEGAGRPFSVIRLPFLPQECWDEMLLACDFNIVRGEETLARAALAGRPFMWQAYLQAGAHHLVKVRAFLERLEPWLDARVFALLSGATLAFNERERDEDAWRGTESILPLLRASEAAEGGFSAFSRELSSRGDMALHLLTFLRDLV
jgi:uncharacterized repeat protein (TIGR03837 family)